MADFEMSKNAEKLLCTLYKVYLERRKSGLSKSQARYFGLGEIAGLAKQLKWNVDDTEDAARELGNVGALDLYMQCSGSLEDKAIIYMENRFKNGLVDVLAFLSNFIP